MKTVTDVFDVMWIRTGDQDPGFHPRSNNPNLYVLVPQCEAAIPNYDNALSPCQCYQIALTLCRADVLVMLHADVTIHDADWATRLMALFENPNCVAAGMGGALALGSPDLYKKPYLLQRMARRGYRSNQTDWEVHGERETGACRVAVLDAFCMAVRTDWLRSRGGWPVDHLTHHCLDLWLACEAAKDGKEIWMSGISVTHHGGGVSTKPAYANAKWLNGGSMEEDHRRPHRWLFDTYRDVLPIEVSHGR